MRLISKARKEVLSGIGQDEEVTLDACDLHQLRLFIIDSYASLKKLEEAKMERTGGMTERRQFVLFF